MFDYFESVDKEYQDKKELFDKLSLDRCEKIPIIGSRVLIAAGLLGRGFIWERLEAIVLECASTAYKVRYVDEKDAYGKDIIEWVHQNLITDVLE